MSKRKKKSERARLTKRLDELVKQIVRLIYEDTCQKCEQKCYGRNSHPHHIIPKGRGGGASWRRFDLRNVILLCGSCHKYWWHLNITEAARWFAGKWPHLDNYLEKYRGGKSAKISTVDMVYLEQVLKLKLQELQNE